MAEKNRGAQGQELHRHRRLADQAYVWHSHEHTCTGEDLNRLHHHPPQEHARLTHEELTHDAVDEPSDA